MSSDEAAYSIQAVADTEAGISFIELGYAVGDQLNAAGAVYLDPSRGAVGSVPRRVLNTDDGLSALWASPSGALWVGSASGHVATTASTTWPTADDMDYESTDPSMPWSVARLPPVAETGLPPSIDVVWGLSDQIVYAGCYGGHIYRWDGTRWEQVHQGQRSGHGGIRAFAGARVDDLIAVGSQGVFLHCSGSNWRPVPIPGDANGRENFTGAQLLEDGTFIVCVNGSQGRLLHGTAAAMTELCRTPLQLIGMAPLGNRILFAVGEGVAELFGSEIRLIKSNFQTAAVWKGTNAAYFLEPAPPTPRYIRYTPENPDRKWVGVTH